MWHLQPEKEDDSRLFLVNSVSGGNRTTIDKVFSKARKTVLLSYKDSAQRFLRYHHKTYFLAFIKETKGPQISAALNCPLPAVSSGTHK